MNKEKKLNWVCSKSDIKIEAKKRVYVHEASKKKKKVVLVGCGYCLNQNPVVNMMCLSQINCFRKKKQFS